jgi:predicted nucleic acid-binding protein
VVVDTSVWIDLLNDLRTPEADLLARALDEGDPVLVPALVLTEVLQGLQSEADAKRIADLMTAFPAPPELEPEDYRRAAALYRTCRASGMPSRSTIDCIIAQICLKFDLPILSRGRDYPAIAQIAPLQILAIAAS